MFKSCVNHGFQMVFANGYKVSCQFGASHYCSRRNLENFDYYADMYSKNPIIESPDCEIAVITTKNKAEDEFVTGEIISALGLDLSGDGMVSGWVSADDAAKIIAYVQGLEA